VRDIAWDKLELIIFDVDGTLYNQSKLRKRILLSLMSHYAARPWEYRDLFILYHFRKEREKHAGKHFNNLEDEQYEWCSKKTGISISHIRWVIDKWMFNYPNQFLLNYMFPGTKEFIKAVTDHKILTAVYSDYPAEKKIQMMNLDFNMLVSSTDHFINAMKPSPKGVNYIINQLNISNKSNCLFIGDRYELDGKCAKFADIPFLLLDRKEADAGIFKKLSDTLRNSRTHLS
jgi:FMN phosphatase YigB (HAD superfamily)